MRLRSKRVLAGIAAALAVLAVSSVALANGGPRLLGLGGGGGNQTELLNAVAKNLGVSGTALRKAVKDALKTQVDQQVKDGVLTKAQGDALKSRIDGGAVHLGVGGPGMGMGAVNVLEAVSSYLGMSVADIRSGFASGKSLADLAKDKGKTSQGLQDAIVAAATSQLAAAVAAGDLTSAQRDAILTRLKNTVDELVTQAHGLGGRMHDGDRPPAFGPGPGFMPGPMFGRGMHHR